MLRSVSLFAPCAALPLMSNAEPGAVPPATTNPDPVPAGDDTLTGGDGQDTTAGVGYEETGQTDTVEGSTGDESVDDRGQTDDGAPNDADTLTGGDGQDTVPPAGQHDGY